MKSIVAMTALLAFTSFAHAEMLSSCHKACFEAKRACGLNNKYTFNSCAQDEFACRASCNSGNKQEVYESTKLPLEIAFHPILKN